MGDGAAVDVAVVGGGHNGLVCATYLARSGLDVVVLERADRPGGALMWTEWEGHQLELGAVEHTAILTSGVLEELDLAAHGLRYVTRTAAAVHLFGDGSRVLIEETAEATAASIAEISAADAEAWRRLADTSTPLLTALALASDGWIPPPGTAARFARLVAGRRADELIEMTRMSVADLAMRWFESPQLRALAMFRATFSGLAPWSPGSAAAFLLTTAGHGRRFGRPVGGSRAVVTALGAALRAAGGEVRCGFDVTAVERSGSAWLVRSASGEVVTARRAVVSAMAPRPFLRDLLRSPMSRPVRARVESIEEVADNLSQLTLAAALDDTECLPALGRAELDGGTMWLLTRPAAVLDTYTAAQFGQVPASPATLVTFPSVADPSAAPPGRATMWANSFAPRHLHGRPWAHARCEVTEAVWRTIDACFPAIREHVAHQLLTTPDDLSARLGADNAGTHVATRADQTLGWRPAPGFGNYRTPVDGIFLTGAGTHPGGGVSGASGRASAMAVLDSLSLGRSRVGRGARVARQTVASGRAARRLAHDHRSA